MPGTSTDRANSSNNLTDTNPSEDNGNETSDLIDEYGSFFDVRKFKWQNTDIVTISLNQTELTANDVDFLSRIRHQNIVELYGLDDTKKNIRCEYLDFETLTNYLHGKEQREYTMRDLFSWMYQAAQGLQCIHSMEPNLAFQVLNPRRFKLTNNFRNLKICGILQRLSLNELEWDYASPEFMEDKKLTHQGNVYSFGIILWELMSRKNPYCHLNCAYYQIKDKVLEGERPMMSEIQVRNSEPIKELIELCWSSDPVKRPKIEEILLKIDHCRQSLGSSTLDHVFSADIGALMNFEAITIGDKISEGNFGVVYKANWRSLNISLKELKHSIGNEHIKQQCRQLMAYTGLQHENIVNILGIAIDGESKYLLMEYVEGSSLFNHLQNRVMPLTLDVAFKWMVSIAKAIDYLICEEKLNPLYLCNMKSKNIMFEPEYLDRLKYGTIIYPKVPKLCNFCFVFEDKDVLKNNLSPSYTAPELFKTGEFTEQSIVYTFGIILWEVIARKMPFYEYEGNQTRIRSAVKRGGRPNIKDTASKGSNLLEIFLTKCWNQNPTERYKIDELSNTLQNLESDLKRVEKRLTIDFAEIGELSNQIGESKFGIVYKTTWRNLEISVKKCKEVYEHEMEPDRMQEITRLLHMDHDNVVRLYGISYCNAVLHLLMAFADCGSLYNYLHGEDKRHYTVKEGLHWMQQAAKGVDHLLNEINIPVIHCNLSSQNMLLFENFRVLKISDYCFPADSKKLLSYQDIAYVAPEILDGKDYSKESDIYSFGIVLWEVMSGKKPYYDVKDPKSVTNVDDIIDGCRRPSLSDVRESEFTFIKDIIERCFDGNPKERPCITELTCLHEKLFEKDVNSDFKEVSNINFADIKFQVESAKDYTFGKFVNAKRKEYKRTSFGEDFENVITKLSRVSHENIMRFYGCTFHDEFAYILTEYLECISLNEYLHGEKKLEYTVACGINWMIQCAKGLAYLHANDILHGELTPYNLQLLEAKKYRSLKIFNFGIVQELTSKREEGNSDFDYMHPKVFGNEKTYTDRYDLYSFGTILWEVLTRKKASFEIRRNDPESRSTDWPILIFDGSERLVNVIQRCWLSVDDIKLDIKWIVSELANILTTSESSVVCQVLETLEKTEYEKRAQNKLNNKSYKPEVHYAEAVNYHDIKKQDLLGCGAQGAVYKAQWSNETIAIKSYDLTSEKNKKSFKNEIMHLSLLVHENIVKILGVTFDLMKSYVLMEYSECGSLYDFVHGDKQRNYKMSHGIDWMIQLTKAIEFMHGQIPAVAHRDLKTQNILLFNEFKHLKICDFGVVKELTTLNTDVGTPGYYAPEIGNKNYTEKCDIFSFGIILWEVMSRCKPFHQLNNFAYLYQVGKGNRPPLEYVVPECKELKNLIENCWDHDPEKRPDAKSIYLADIPISEDIDIIKKN